MDSYTLDGRGHALLTLPDYMVTSEAPWTHYVIVVDEMEAILLAQTLEEAAREILDPKAPPRPVSLLDAERLEDATHNITYCRDHFTEVFQRVAQDGERILVTRQPDGLVMALVPAADLAELTRRKVT